MRLFIAVAFDSLVKSKISELYDCMRRAGVTGSFTPADNFHLTLKFLGEVDGARIGSVKEALDSAAGTVCSFGLKSGKCGFFASRGEKTVWLGINGDGLSALARSVDLELSRLGFEREKRAFTPHITLVRRASCDTDILSRVKAPDIAASVNSVTLFESRRDGGRLWYKPLHSAGLSTR
jgi:RNA 2',3'-cyclic 3'-phosphodiesterase